mgnify:CR=1 FL=1
MSGYDIPQAKKEFGQNYLTDPNYQRKLYEAMAPANGEPVVEIGPGPGALTRKLMEGGHKVIAVEKDPRFEEILNQLADETGADFTLKLGDALSFDFSTLPHPVKLVGNLPYNIGTQLVINALYQRHLFTELVFMLQKEVVERIVAQPGENQWGRLAIFCDLLCERQKLFNVPPAAFRPQPKVTSSIVRLVPLDTPRFEVDITKLEKVVKQAFGQRRKMLRASLKGLATEGQFEQAGIAPTARPETLSTEDFCRLVNTLS